MDEPNDEPKKSKYSKVGRPRKYVGGWTSVSNLLVKQIKLHTTVYIRWCKLKGARQHSEFASMLLDLYERSSKNILHEPKEEVTVEVEVEQPQIVVKPQRAPLSKISRRKKILQTPVHIECYEDKPDSQDDDDDNDCETRTSIWKRGLDKCTKSPSSDAELPPYKKARKSQVKITKDIKKTPITKSICTTNVPTIPVSSTVVTETTIATTSYFTSNPVVSLNPMLHQQPHFLVPIVNGKPQAPVFIPKQMAPTQMNTPLVLFNPQSHLNPSSTLENKSGRPMVAPPMIASIMQPQTKPVAILPKVTVKPQEGKGNIMRKYPPVFPSLANCNISSTNPSTINDKECLMPLNSKQSSTVSLGVTSPCAVTNQYPVSVVDTINNTIKKAVFTPKEEAASSGNTNKNTVASAAKEGVVDIVDNVNKKTPCEVSSIANSTNKDEIVTTSQGKLSMSTAEINIVPQASVISTIDLTSQLQSTNAELAAARIISSLSESFVKAVSADQKTEQSKPNQCPNCQKARQPVRKNVKVVKVRHMATQFTTQLLNVKSCRHVSTQTFSNDKVSVETYTEDYYIRRSVETQSWPSLLWSKFLIQHPEVIYNIDLSEQPEFPPRFRLYRKGDKLFSTLFGSKYQIQKRPSMRCISVTEFGGPEVLRLLHSIPTPKPSAKQVLVNVKAAGVNPVDTYIRSGIYANQPSLPYTPGKDGAGIVQQIGEDVSKVKKGDRVWFFGSMTGSYSEYCICHEDNIGQLPKNVPFEDGAMVGTPYLTAYRALFQKGKVKRGETILIHGGTGGVGTAAVQICNSCGIRVIATAGSEDGENLLREMGVDKVYNHRKEEYVEEIKNGEHIDVILEMLANVNLLEDLNIISANGRIVIIGSRGPIEINPRLIMLKEATITGVMLFKCTATDKLEQLSYLNEGLQAGWLRPKLWKSIELEFAKDAHREIIENTGAKGQIVLKINASYNAPEYVPTDL